MSVDDARGGRVTFANDGPDDEAPRAAREGDARSPRLRSACIELASEADAATAERFIVQRACLTRYAPLAHNG